MLAERIRVLDKLQHALEVQDKENEPLREGLESEFFSIMTLCDQLNEKVEHLHDDDTCDDQFGSIALANGLFDALDKLDGLFSRLVSSETTVGNTLEPVQEQASAKSEKNWIFDLIIKLKKVETHIRKELLLYGNRQETLEEFICKLENLEHELKVKHKENEKLWDGLESEFSAMMTICDQLNEKYEHLHDSVTADERGICDEDDSCDSNDIFKFTVLVRSFAASKMVNSLFNTLDKLDKHCSRLEEWIVGNRGKGLQTLDIGKEKVDYNKNNAPTKENNVIPINSPDILVEQLEIAQTSKIPVVMLFNAKGIKPSKEYLPKFYDLPNQYRGDIKFFRVDLKQAATEFKVRAYPTVLVLLPRSCGLRVDGRLSIEETIIVPAFVKALKTLLDACLWECCGHMGKLQQV